MKRRLSQYWMSKKHYRNGTTLVLQGMPEKGVEEFSKAIEANPEFLDAYLHRGTAYLDISNSGLGLSDLTT